MLDKSMSTYVSRLWESKIFSEEEIAEKVMRTFW